MRYITGAWSALRGLFPFTHAGRQTLVYLLYAWSVPLLTLMVQGILQVTAAYGRWDIYADVADKVANALLIGVVGYACFVSIRAIKIGKDGVDFQSKDNGEGSAQVTTVTQTTVSPADNAGQ